MNDDGRLTPEVMRRYAELGAQTRFEQLRDEITTLLAAFPNLDPDMSRLGAVLYPPTPAPAGGVTLPAARAAYRARERVKRRRRRVEATPPGVTMPAKRRRRKMTAEARLAVSTRMKKYWAGRRKEQRGSNNGATAH